MVPILTRLDVVWSVDTGFATLGIRGGWGIINLEEFNRAFLGRWWWKISSGGPWCGSAPILHNYYHHQPRWNLWRTRSRCCSFWQGLFPSLEVFRACLRSIVGNGNCTLFWLDNWYDDQAPKYLWWEDFQAVTSPFTTVREVLTGSLTGGLGLDLSLASVRSRLISTVGDCPDSKRWKLTQDGSFPVRSFYRFLIDRGLRCNITPVIFKCPVPRKIAAFSWLAWDKKILTLDTLFARGCNKLPTTTCLLCCSDEESCDHLFFKCPIARGLWTQLAPLFAFSWSPSSYSNLWGSWYRELSPHCKLSSSLIARVVLWQIWLARNNCIFNYVFISTSALFLKICYMYLYWIPAVPPREMHRLDESIAAIRRCIQFSDSAHKVLDSDEHDDLGGLLLLLGFCGHL
ncbi:Reverse transcriptase zinc-binding domain-containing protein [Dioscorea alata]|uniref:Reverse transcriptase zinc-binding domain-containing protein n=1 Tax=Dioscorea alata TaxID=55571 RepID=A0ACB7UK30_DIOAL|nr:Reverse transcriptase zinc-binding domain-containing protein [Dioscorea alata]